MIEMYVLPVATTFHWIENAAPVVAPQTAVEAEPNAMAVPAALQSVTAIAVVMAADPVNQHGKFAATLTVPAIAEFVVLLSAGPPVT